MPERERSAAEGATVGKYRIVSLLGQGGTAEVYLAAADGPRGFCKLVVLKTLKEHLACDEEFRAMFLHEARLAALLHHPNIVQTNEVLEPPGATGAPVIVMEYLDGQPLSQLIARGRADGVSTAMQLRILADALAGLHAAHELRDFDGAPLGVVHRDVSPHNLFVTVEGQAKVLDFGIAKLDRSLVETEVGTIKGKLRYMAPEQLAGGRVDRRTDIYSAGVILWEALAGERMWKGRDEEEIRTRVQTGALPLPQARRPEVPAALQAICQRALSLFPADRYPTALALADEVEAALPALGTVKRREIGRTVTRLFQEERAATRRAIEERLGRQASPSSTTVTRTQEISAPLVDPELVTLLASLTPAARTAPRRWRARLIWAGATVALLLAAAALAWRAGILRWPAVTPGSARVPSVTAGPSSSAAAASRALAAPQAAPSPELSAAVLRALRHAKAARLGIKHSPSEAAPAAAPPAPPRDCDHPFFVDADGIKRFRPECR